MKTNNYVCHAPYLRNSTAYDHEFWYTCVKWWYLEVLFNFFHIFIFLAVRAIKEQKIAQKTKNSVCRTSYIRNHTSWLSFVVHKCKMIISSSIFFIFSNFWSFGLLGGSKGKINSPKWQNILSLALQISGTIHQMTLIYGAQM